MGKVKRIHLGIRASDLRVSIPYGKGKGNLSHEKYSDGSVSIPYGKGKAVIPNLYTLAVTVYQFPMGKVKLTIR